MGNQLEFFEIDMEGIWRFQEHLKYCRECNPELNIFCPAGRELISKDGGKILGEDT